MKNLFKLDGWRSLLSGLGVTGQDKKMSYATNWVKMSETEQESLYACDELASKVVDYVPEEIVRKGFKFTHPEADAEFDKEVKNVLKKYGAQQKTVSAMKNGRLSGGAFLVMGINDGKDPSEPLDVENIKSIDWIRVISRWDISFNEVSRDITSDYFRNPETYSITNAEGDENLLNIHASRMIRFDGAHLPRRLYENNSYFHDSVLNKVQASLRNYNLATDSAASTLEEFSMGIFKMKGLAQLISSGNEDKVITRLGLINAKKSIVRSIVLDQDEEYKRENVNLTGIPNVIEKLGNKLVADTNMPHTVLLGEGAEGTLGGGGMSETRNWYDYIAKQQVNMFKPRYMLLTRMLMEAEGMKIPEGFDMEFESLYEYTDVEKADMRLKTSQADASDIVNNVLDPDEVALSRYGSGKYSMDTKIDKSLREEGLSNGEQNGEEEDLDGKEGQETKAE